MTELQISGSFSREAVDTLRRELADIRVGLQQGLGGERLLKIIGSFSKDQVEHVRAFLLRMLGEGQIGKITIKHDSIEIASVAAKDLDSVKSLVDDLAKHLRPVKSR